VRKARTLYYNDARRHYLFVIEPPMSVEDAWQPVDEVSGTPVDTFVYAVSRRDGLFYPSKVGMRFGGDILPFKSASWWRAWHNMQSLIDQGIDPLGVLIDRTKEKGMDFFACLRVGAFGEMDAGLNVRHNGLGYKLPQVRDHALACARELAEDYPVDGIELDFTDPSGPGSSSLLGYFDKDNVQEYTPVMTDWVRRVSDLVRNRAGGSGVLGARIYPTESVNLGAGLDVRTWIREKLIDYVAPNVREPRVLHQNMEIDWLIELADTEDVSIYPLLHSMYREDKYANLAMMRAAFSNYRARNVDGLYTWALEWPLRDDQRDILIEQGNPNPSPVGPKHYFVPKQINEPKGVVSYESVLPLSIDSHATGIRYALPLYISDDLENDPDRKVHLRLFIHGLVNADQFSIYLNGVSIMDEESRTYFHDSVEPFVGRWVEINLDKIRPQIGDNVVEIELHRRGANDVSNPAAAHGTGLAQPFTVDEVELLLE